MEKKLPSLIEQLSKLTDNAPSVEREGKGKKRQAGGSVGTLASFLKEKKADASQNKRFLATAEWLHQKGKDMLKTGDITKALKDNHQTRLGNPSDTLHKNVSKGFCEKHGQEFFVTDEGRKELA